MSQTNANTADELDNFVSFLESKVGYINRNDKETVTCLKGIMQTKLNVFGDLYVE